MTYFIGVDVGSGSARAGVFDAAGRKQGEGSFTINTFKPQSDFFEQSSEEIWQAVCSAVRQALTAAGLEPAQVKGIGFDATCSLVVLDREGQPMTVSLSGRSEQNIIMWMDHRATAQADVINRAGYPELAYVGNRISPEMQTPKLLWLKEQMPDSWEQAGYFFDLPDFLTWRCTDDPGRSLCSTVCKWTYLGHEQRWSRDYFAGLGLEELLADGARKIGACIRPPGTPAGKGLTTAAAMELGLLPGTPVGTSMIDAHAGGIGILGASDQGESVDLERRLALICGTSSCHMAVSTRPRFIDGVWGPYHGAMLPSYWLNEGGQSATGALIDHVIASHPQAAGLAQQAQTGGATVYQLLNEHLEQMAGSFHDIPLLTHEMHILPYFHGNRSPRANPHLTGTVTGLRLSHTLDDLALLYLATIQALALGTRHIIDQLNQAGYQIDTLVVCGGGAKNPLMLQEHANATGCTLLLPRESEAVLLGASMLGAVAGGAYDSIMTAMTAMSRIGRRIVPADRQVAAFYQAKYQVFHQLYEDDCKYRGLMQASGIDIEYSS